MNRTQKKVAARIAAAAALIAAKVSHERAFTVRVVRTGRATSVLLTTAMGEHKAPESRIAQRVRAEAAERIGTTSEGENPALTFGEAWRIATGVAAKLGAGSFGVPSLGARYDTQGKRVA